jgi:hypothetical protein
MASPGHASRSADHHGTVVEVVTHADECVFLFVRWSDGRLSVIPASECVVEIDDVGEPVGIHDGCASR